MSLYEINLTRTVEGNDGPWSSFDISVGTPPQIMSVFISTSVYQTLVVVPEGCPAVSSNCSVLRGGEFFLNESSTWETNMANASNNLYPMEVDTQLGYNGNAELGFDVVSLAGIAETTLKNQTVGGFAVNDSYLGIFGIDPRSSNFANAPQIQSYLFDLRNQSLIPSLSWGYTAGNQYRKAWFIPLGLVQLLKVPGSNKSFGSLTLGGYDRSRFAEHDGSWSIDSTYNLAVPLQSITATSGGVNTGLLATPITAVIDSSLPYIWLPQPACQLFEDAFGLVWNDAAQLYLINDTQHTTLVQQNASVTFNLNGLTNGSNTDVNITFPYAAFDLTASDPLAKPPSRY